MQDHAAVGGWKQEKQAGTALEPLIPFFAGKSIKERED